MSLITILYLLLVIAGVVWIAYRFMVFMRDERERDARWAMMASDERLRGFLDSLKQEKKGTGKDQTGSDARKASSGKTNQTL